MSELEIARIKRELANIDRLNNDLYGSLNDGSNTSLHRWFEIKKMAMQHREIDAAEIDALIRPAVSAARALYLVELIQNNLEPRLYPHLIAFLDHDYSMVWRGACRVLGRTNDPAVRRELERRFEMADEPFRGSIAEALADLGSEEVPDYLAQQLREPDQYSKLTAVRSLGKLRGSRVDDLLLEALYDRGKYAANAAEEELSNPERCTTFLKDRLREMCAGKDAKVKLRAVRLLGFHRDQESAGILASMYEHASRQLRCQILLALGHFGTREAMKHILGLMRDEDIETTAYGCMALGKCSFPEAVERLMEIYRERRFGEGRIDLIIHSNLYVLAAECLKRNECDHGTRYMIELLDSDEPRIREEMAKGLGTRMAVEALEKMEVLQSQETNEKVKGALERACTKLRKAAMKGSAQKGAGAGRKKKA